MSRIGKSIATVIIMAVITFGLITSAIGKEQGRTSNSARVKHNTTTLKSGKVSSTGSLVTGSRQPAGIFDDPFFFDVGFTGSRPPSGSRKRTQARGFQSHTMPHADGLLLDRRPASRGTSGRTATTRRH